MKFHNYYVYITTNAAKTVLYIGVTNDLARRISEHHENRGKNETFAGRFYCLKLIYWERFSDINDAISREKELKGWRRSKKEALINEKNPNWNTLDPE